MNKRILIACSMAIFGVWIALVMLGQKMLPGAPIRKAWIVPLGANGWEHVMKEIDMSKDTLIGILGEPDEVSVSANHAGQVYLHYTNPHDSERDVSFAVSPEQKILYAAPGAPMPSFPRR